MRIHTRVATLSIIVFSSTVSHAQSDAGPSDGTTRSDAERVLLVERGALTLQPPAVSRIDDPRIRRELALRKLRLLRDRREAIERQRDFARTGSLARTPAVQQRIPSFNRSIGSGVGIDLSARQLSRFNQRERIVAARGGTSPFVRKGNRVIINPAYRGHSFVRSRPDRERRER